jgi:T5SS/PEP-CTERM-associated repeat protein
MKSTRPDRLLRTLLLLTGGLFTFCQASAQNLYVGSNSSGNSTNFTSGTNSYFNTFVGYAAGADSNSLSVSNSGTLLDSSGFNLYVGDQGASNSMVIAAGAVVNDTKAYIGNSNSSFNNSVLVTGSGSTWSNFSDLAVGNYGSGNLLVISNGGTVSAVDSTIGFRVASSSNSVIVTGAGSIWSNSGTIAGVGVGLNGDGNSLLVSNGGSVIDTNANIGGSGTASNNSVTVTGSGSTWSNSSTFVVGDSGSGNTVLISGGGAVVDLNGTIAQSGGSNNSVTVTGSGSTWSNTALTVGSVGSGTLTVANGGTVSSSSSIIIASTAGSSGTLNIGSLGTNDTAGSLVTPFIVFGSGTGTLNFNQRDAFTISGHILGGGSVNQLGSGTTILLASNNYSGATLVNGGRLTVETNGAIASGGVTISSGGTLENNGVIGGTTTVNGTLAGNGGSFHTLKFNADSFLNWNIDSFTGTEGTNWDHLSAQSLDLTNVTSVTPVTISIAGTSGMGNGSSVYSFNFLSVTGSVDGFNPANILLNTSNFTLDPALVGGTWSVDTNSIIGGTSLSVMYSVPEPSTYGYLLISALLGVVLRRVLGRSAKSV